MQREVTGSDLLACPLVGRTELAQSRLLFHATVARIVRIWVCAQCGDGDRALVPRAAVRASSADAREPPSRDHDLSRHLAHRVSDHTHTAWREGVGAAALHERGARVWRFAWPA